MRHETGERRGRGGCRLFGQRWLPDGDVRGIAVLSHGLAEHGGRYLELATRLVARGCALYAEDHRGHGRSAGRRCLVASFADVVADLAATVAIARARHPDRRLLLIGHSFGGAVALRAALDAPELADRLVLSAPAIGRDPMIPRARLLLGRLLSAIAPATGILTLPAGAISSDPEVVAAYRRDPLVYRGAIPARTLVELLAAMDAIAARAAQLRIPTLLMHGTDDTLVPLELNRRVYAALGAGDVELRLYEGFRHEILNEPERARVYADLEAWLDARP